MYLVSIQNKQTREIKQYFVASAEGVKDVVAEDCKGTCVVLCEEIPGYFKDAQKVVNQILEGNEG